MNYQLDMQQPRIYEILGFYNKYYYLNLFILTAHSTVAFQVALDVRKSGPRIVNNNETVMFNRPFLDTSGGYNVNTGTYIVPQIGIYVITWDIDVYSDSICRTHLFVNDANKGHLTTDGGPESSPTSTVTTGVIVTHLNQGDSVHIRQLGSRNCRMVGDQTSFSGWLLH